MVLAAGASRRLRPETDGLPKALLPVDGVRTILDIALRNFSADGLTEAVIVVGYAAQAVADRLPALARESGIRIELVHNDRAEEWNNAYSLWLAREYFERGVLLVNGDTLHPVSIEKTLLAASASARTCGAQRAPALGRLIIAIDDIKPLAGEEMKDVLDAGGLMGRSTKPMEPAPAP